MGWPTGIGTLVGTGAGAIFGGPAGAALGAGLGGAFDQMMGAGDANQANWDNARAAEAFSERMSSTAHQRQVKDLTAAGLNPMLSVNSGASAPTGAMSVAQNTAEGLAASAMEISKAKLAFQRAEKENDLLDAQTGKAKMETKVMSRGVPEAETKNMLFDVIRPYLKKMKENVQDAAPKKFGTKPDKSGSYELKPWR